ncbi:hypothetical protein [Sinorhizobium fredii]|uniref:hypothetical protein n=1 Tax=Rhizobium fredii TaxID=380 RepID=UPI000563E931|nr:hypothetical protein [Sinorhizobium fredii]
MAFRDTWKRMNWLAFALVGTLAYTALIGFMLGWAKIQAFFVQTTALNEIGDFLAGVFAPIALVWLIAAVFTQRQELDETRDQFTENQKVVDAQLKTINAQNALLSLQHNQAVENAKQAYRLSLFDKRFAIYEKFVKFEADHSGKDYDEASYWAMINLTQEAAFVFDKSIEDWFDDIAREIYDYIEFKEENPPKAELPNISPVPSAAEKFNQALRAEYDSKKSWINEQFLPDTRTSKFWHYMYVSDQPLIPG